MNTNDFFNIAFAICPDRDFIVFEKQKQTYLDTWMRINQLSNILAAQGVGNGDRVGMMAVNCPEYVEAYFAAAKLGAIFVPLNYRAKSEEIAYMLEAAEIKAMFVGERYVEMLSDLAGSAESLQCTISIDGPAEGMIDYHAAIETADADEIYTEIDDDDVTILMFTSGTTGRPKAVPMTHTGFSSYILENVSPADPDVEETNILTVPMYHVAGIQGMLAAVYGGRTIALMPQFDVKHWLETVQDEKANRAMLVPTMLKQIIEYPEFSNYDLSSLGIITYGAAPMPFEVIKKAIDIFPDASFINAFGQTETGSTITMLGPEDHVIQGTDEEKERQYERLRSSIGKPLPDIAVMIVDEKGEPVPNGVVGEIVAMGPRVMSGYWHDEKKTAAAFTADGWLYTSDLGYMDDEGYIYLKGRADDMIIRGGENISPGEVEAAITAHPKVDEAVVIGVPSEEWGQEPHALVVLKAGETATAEEIGEFTRSHLASFKCPKEVKFVDSLPRNALGKLSRKQLVQDYQAG